MEDGCKYEIVDAENIVWFSGRFSDEMSLRIFEELYQYLPMNENSDVIDIEEDNWEEYGEEEEEYGDDDLSY